MQESLHQQRRRHQQHHGQRDLGRHHRGPEPRAAPPRGPAATALLQGRVHILPRRLKRRGESRHDAREQRDDDAVGEDSDIEPYLVEAREIGGEEACEAAHHRIGQEQTHQATQGAQQDALGEQLPRDAPPSGAERRTNRQLAFPPGRPCQQEVGDVGGGDQQ